MLDFLAVCFPILTLFTWAHFIENQRQSKGKDINKKVVTKEEEGEQAMEVTATEGPREAGEGARVLVQRPWRTCQTPTFSSAGARRCLPELSYVMLDSTETITPKAAAGSYLR